jgi:SNF2 family DNA or RNA helicase
VLYQSIAHKGLAAKKASDAPVGGLNNAIMQMRKVCNHPYLFLRDCGQQAHPSFAPQRGC